MRATFVLILLLAGCGTRIDPQTAAAQRCLGSSDYSYCVATTAAAIRQRQLNAIGDSFGSSTAMPVYQWSPPPQQSFAAPSWNARQESMSPTLYASPPRPPGGCATMVRAASGDLLLCRP
jgi:hypothetical protein